MIHLTLNQISAYLDAELPMASVELVRLHLSSCLECTERFGHVEEQEEALARLLVSDPGDAFFDEFSVRVLGPPRAVEPLRDVKTPEPSRLEPTTEPPGADSMAEPARAARKAEEPPTPAEAVRPAPTTAEPVRPTLTPAEAVRPALTTATVRPALTTAAARPAITTATPRRPPRKRGGGFKVALSVGALLLVVSAISIATLRSRPTVLGYVPESVRSSAERTIERVGSVLGSLGAGTAPTETNRPGATEGGTDPLGTAAAASSRAGRSRSAAAYDEAAQAWEAAIPELQANADELAAGRREIATARISAWNLDPTPERRDAATTAVRAYLLCAPPGADRDQAWTWLADLKR